MRAREFITEAFDQPYPLTWEKSDADDSMDALARLPDGSNLSIMFNQDLDDEGEGIYSVEFWRGNSQDVTGAGDAQRIFATVLEAIKQFIEQKNPEQLYFSANKDVEPGQKAHSRSNLYTTLVRRYARALGYEADVSDFAGSTGYKLYRLNEQELSEISRDRLERYLSRAGRQVNTRQERMARARQRLNTSYEIYHADEPTKIVDHFEADTPADAQRYYQDYIERYESDVDYDLRLRRGTGIMEFAPSPERDDNDDIPDPIFVLANRWWNATDKQPQIEHVLNSMGWSIHQVESEDDAVQLQHRDGTTYFISADDFDPDVFENFADGKIKGKSRPGRVKRAGASCKGSVTDLRARAKKYGGERGKMYHWCANMKAGKKK